MQCRVATRAHVRGEAVPKNSPVQKIVPVKKDTSKLVDSKLTKVVPEYNN
jgi:hypothetical protein